MNMKKLKEDRRKMFWELYLRVKKNKKAKIKAVGETLDLLTLLVANC